MKQKLEGFIITTKNTTMKKLTKITLIIASLLIAVTLVGCYNNTAKDEVNWSTGEPTAIPKVKELEDVKSYTIKSKLFSWGKSYA